MKALWLIQENLNEDDRILLPILDYYNQPYKLFKMIPFSDSIGDLDDFKYDGPIIVRGTTTSLKNLEKKEWSPGVWHNSNFKPSKYKEEYGEFFLNSEGYSVKLKDFRSDLGIFGTSHFFIRPNSDYKEFTGNAVSSRSFKKFQKGVLEYKQYPFDGNLEIFVAPLIKIINEYRFVVAKDKIISGFPYQVNKQFRTQYSFGKVTKFAETMAQMWGPDDVYCLDIGVTKDNKIGVIECNCFNASGIYGDHDNIVKSISCFVQKTIRSLL